jgi:hypothetical protein
LDLVNVNVLSLTHAAFEKYCRTIVPDVARISAFQASPAAGKAAINASLRAITRRVEMSPVESLVRFICCGTIDAINLRLVALFGEQRIASMTSHAVSVRGTLLKKRALYKEVFGPLSHALGRNSPSIESARYSFSITLPHARGVSMSAEHNCVEAWPGQAKIIVHIIQASEGRMWAFVHFAILNTYGCASPIGK